MLTAAAVHCCSVQYIHHPPYFQTMTTELEPVKSINAAYALLNLGDSITTDHISPAGDIAKTSPAARFLIDRGVDVRELNTYGARRGNDLVMQRYSTRHTIHT